MKTCPICRTQYTDDTLRFCLQDGTPLTSITEAGDPAASLTGGEEETVARARPRPNEAAAAPKRRRSTLAVASLAAAIVLLFLTIAGSVGLWLYFRDPADRTAKNAENGRGNQNQNAGAISNLNRNARPAPTRTSNVSGNANPPSPSPTPPTDNTEASREVSGTIAAWEAESEQGDLNALMSRYANSVEYYRRQSASPGFIRADKQRAFRRYDSMSFAISNLNVTVADSGESATAVFDKEWVFEGPNRSTGKVQQQLRFRRIDGEWRITGERDLKVYYTN